MSDLTEREQQAQEFEQFITRRKTNPNTERVRQNLASFEPQADQVGQMIADHDRQTNQDDDPTTEPEAS